MSGGAASATNTHTLVIIATNRPIVFPPSVATTPLFRSLAIAMMSNEVTSGTTVIRIAFTQSVPIGSTTAGRVVRNPPPNADMKIPLISPRTRPTSILAVRDILPR